MRWVESCKLTAPFFRLRLSLYKWGIPSCFISPLLSPLQSSSSHKVNSYPYTGCKDAFDEGEIRKQDKRLPGSDQGED